jgi:ribose 1,5-bisphosphokinase PhnN
MTIRDQLATLRRTMADAHIRAPECLRPAVTQILPDGRMFEHLRLGSSMDVDRSLRHMLATLTHCIADGVDAKQVSHVAATLRSFLDEAEVSVLQTLDLDSPHHQAFLLLLREIHPPEKPRRPIVFLVAGPSASGKDYVTHKVFEALRARGYACQFVLKYIQRTSRPEERRIAPFLRYQIALSPEEFSQLQNSGEVVCPYSKYGSLYGFSMSNLERLLHSDDPSANICIMSAFEQAETFVQFLTTLGFSVVPVLLHASLQTCRRRLLGRLLALREDQSFDESKATAELWLRAEEVAKDIALIQQDESPLDRIYVDRISNDRDGDSRAMQELYRFFAARLTADAEAAELPLEGLR